MDVLDLEEVLDHELQLLDIPGKTLSDFYCVQEDIKIFHPSQPKSTSKLNPAKRLITPKTSFNSSNAVFHILTHTLLKVMFAKHHNYQILQHLKCSLYSPKINISKIYNSSAQALPDLVGKKILVEFFQVMQYHTGDTQLILIKYPIILELFTFFFRTILNNLGVPSALNFHKKIPSNTAIQKIFDYFDLNYFCRKGMYIIEEQQIGLFIDPKTDQVYFGSIKMMAQQQSDHSFNFSQESANQDPAQFQKRQQSMSTPTPQFGEFADEEINFKRESHRRKNSTSQSNKYFDFKFGDEPIEEKIEQQEDDIKKSKRSTRRMSQNNISITFDPNRLLKFMPNKDKILEQQSLNSPSSPIPDSKDFLVSFAERRISQQADPEKEDRNSPYSHTGQANNSFEENITKSDKIWGQSKSKNPSKNRKSYKQQNASNNSCSCLSTRTRKNALKSKVVDISIVPYQRCSKQNSIISESTSNLLAQEEIFKQNMASKHTFSRKQGNQHIHFINPNRVKSINRPNNGLGFGAKMKISFTYNVPENSNGHMGYNRLKMSKNSNYGSIRNIVDSKQYSDHRCGPGFGGNNTLSPPCYGGNRQIIHNLCPKRRSILYRTLNPHF